MRLLTIQGKCLLIADSNWKEPAWNQTRFSVLQVLSMRQPPPPPEFAQGTYSCVSRWLVPSLPSHDYSVTSCKRLTMTSLECKATQHTETSSSVPWPGWLWKLSRSSSSSMYTGGSWDVMKVEGLRRCLFRGCCRLLDDCHAKIVAKTDSRETSNQHTVLTSPHWKQNYRHFLNGCNSWKYSHPIR